MFKNNFKLFHFSSFLFVALTLATLALGMRFASFIVTVLYVVFVVALLFPMVEKGRFKASRGILTALLIAFLFSIFSNSASAQVTADKIPVKAIPYFPLIKQEGLLYFKDNPIPEYIAALVEHESCISLTSKGCWQPSVTFSTKREFAAGVGQITKKYKKDGSLQFDVLDEVRNRYKLELKELDWSTIQYRPDLQIRAMVLMSNDSFKKLYTVTGPINRLHFTDAAYNGGYGGVVKERTYCGLKKDCNPQYWFGNVELACLKNKTPLYGKRSACDINRGHVRLVFKEILPKYQRYWKAFPP